MDKFARMVANGQISRAEAARRRRQAMMQRNVQGPLRATTRNQPGQQNNNTSTIITWSTPWEQMQPNTFKCFDMFLDTETLSPASSIGTHFKLVSVDVVVSSEIMLATDRSARLVVTLSAEQLAGTDVSLVNQMAMTKQGHTIVSWPQFTERVITLSPRVGDLTESNQGALWLFLGNTSVDAPPIRGPGPGEEIPAKPNPFTYRLVYKIRQYQNALNL
jgi:hypothetical protein